MQIMTRGLTLGVLQAARPEVYVQAPVSGFRILEFWRSEEILAEGDREKDAFAPSDGRHGERRPPHARLTPKAPTASWWRSGRSTCHPRPRPAAGDDEAGLFHDPGEIGEAHSVP